MTIGSLDIFPQTTGTSININTGLTGYPLNPTNGGTGVSNPPAHTIPVAQGSSNFNFIGPLTNGQILIGSTGLDPVPATLTAGAGISIVNGAGSITISATGMSFLWIDQTTDTTMVVNQGYVSDSVSQVVLTLPAAPTFGDIVRVAGKGTGGWQIAQNAGQSVHFGSATSTVGAGGSLSSTNAFDALELLCISATEFVVLSSIGNITVI